MLPDFLWYGQHELLTSIRCYRVADIKAHCASMAKPKKLTLVTPFRWIANPIFETRAGKTVIFKHDGRNKVGPHKLNSEQRSLLEKHLEGKKVLFMLATVAVWLDRSFRAAAARETRRERSGSSSRARP